MFVLQALATLMATANMMSWLHLGILHALPGHGRTEPRAYIHLMQG